MKAKFDTIEAESRTHACKALRLPNCNLARLPLHVAQTISSVQLSLPQKVNTYQDWNSLVKETIKDIKMN